MCSFRTFAAVTKQTQWEKSESCHVDDGRFVCCASLFYSPSSFRYFCLAVLAAGWAGWLAAVINIIIHLTKHHRNGKETKRKREEEKKTKQNNKFETKTNTKLI